jgi:hypothetical protein
MKNKITIFTLILITSVILSACGAKKTAVAPTPSPIVAKIVEMPIADRPNISLVPRNDGHLLTLGITKLPSYVNTIEYELIYTATDGSLEIEKGLGDTIKDLSTAIDRKLLLGTESCTNGCKYKYDEGVTGGTLSLKFFDKNGQAYAYDSLFSLKSTADLKKDKLFKLVGDNFEIDTSSAKLTGKDYFVLIKKYTEGYSVFSSGNNSLIGEYPKK